MLMLNGEDEEKFAVMGKVGEEMMEVINECGGPEIKEVTLENEDSED